MSSSNHSKREESADRGGMPTSDSAISVRSLVAFRQVYREACYTNAGLNLNSSRRSVLKLIGDLEKSLGSRLFEETLDGTLTPSHFGERFFNDMRELEGALSALNDQVVTIRSHQRVLRLTAPPIVFRTFGFARVFRKLRSFQGFRTVLVTGEELASMKGLAAGSADLLFGFTAIEHSRAIVQKVEHLSWQEYRRGTASQAQRGRLMVVVPDDLEGELQSNISQLSALSIDPATWLNWLDHPAECEQGATVIAPRIPVDESFWSVISENHPIPMRPLPLYATYLRHHPFEFLPQVIEQIGNSSC